ncbi:hypothetical protein BDZ89DRAFT_1133430 [Hymenopellis radicata]|nr:hypothetical protein BDZ89DRAFT_1133430 [Hymenopellis radicata]
MAKELKASPCPNGESYSSILTWHAVESNIFYLENGPNTKSKPKSNVPYVHLAIAQPPDNNFFELWTRWILINPFWS